MDSFSNFVEIQKLKKELSAKSGNLVRYVVSHTAETDGQRQFAIDISTFNAATDSVWVVSGRTLLSATYDYVVQSHSVVLNEGVPAGRTVDIYIYKNVENLDEEKTIDGLQIAVGSIPLDRLNGSVGGKLHMYSASQEAIEDGQTEFDIPIVSFDETEDALWVFEGYLMLHKDLDYTLQNGKVVLNEGVHVGCTITMYVFKQVEQTGDEKLISGLMIEPATIPLDRLAEEIPTPTAESIGAVKEENLAQTIQNLLTGGEVSMVKSIQSGKAERLSNVQSYVTDFNPDGSNTAYVRTFYRDITINAVNVNKCTVKCETYSSTWNLCELINSTTLRIYVGLGSSTTTSTYSHGYTWEVVEYY